jgi:Protein of unknown function (DUF3106)
MTLPFLRLRLLALLWGSTLVCMNGAVLADPVVRHAAASAGASRPVNLGPAPQWHELTQAQKKVLQPLSAHWPEIDDVGRDKWVNVADRFDKLSPADKQRVQERMSQWSKLPAQERGEARLRFQQSRQMTPDQRQQKWAAYQALSAENRQDLTRQALRKAKPVFLSESTAGPREAGQVFGGKRATTASNSAKKSNLVPGAGNGATPGPTVVSPTLVKAGAGATTTLVTQRPSPPLHQHSGLPKIAASKGFVDPITLLPRKGAQSAAMASLPATASPAAEQAQTRR